MKRHLLKKEWETYIQDYKISGLSKCVWCQKQNLPVHRLYYWLKKLSPETEEQNKNECMNWISMNVPVIEENIHAINRERKITGFEFSMLILTQVGYILWGIYIIYTNFA